MWGETRGEVFGIVLAATGHPRSGLDAAAGHRVIGVLLIRAPRVVGHDDVGLERGDDGGQGRLAAGAAAADVVGRQREGHQDAAFSMSVR